MESLVEFAFTGCFQLIVPTQIPSEILRLLRFVELIKPKVVLEIGTGMGGTLFLFSRIAAEDAVIISVDLPGGRFGGGYSKLRLPLYSAFAGQNQQLHLIRGDSHTREVADKVNTLLNGRRIDFLFIDGDHTYEGVRSDFEIYAPLVMENGLIAFHDIVVHLPETGCEVNIFWKEIKSRFEYIEIVDDPRQKWAGIGMMKMQQGAAGYF